MTTHPQAKPQGRNIGRMLLFALALSGFGGLAAIGGFYYGQQPAGAGPAIPRGVSLTSWIDNGKGGEHVLQIVKGDAPPVGVRLIGTVKTDTDCDPDPQGVNHCHNVIDLENGRSIEVIHNHVMHRYPCLEPGQRLSITRLDPNWVVASRGQPRPVN